MHWLNYHQLHTFWVVARAGTLAAASRELGIGRSAISMQLGQLERSAGAPLFQRTGRRRELTTTGRVVREYADEIFALGRELEQSLRGEGGRRPSPLRVGLVNSIPKSAAWRMLTPALEGEPAARVVVREADLQELLDQLARHRLELVLTDQPPPTGSEVRARTFELGSCGVVLMGSAALVEAHRRDFPRSLDGAPLLLPGQGSVLRREVERWLDAHELRPRVVAEFDDGALMKIFGQRGSGLFPTPMVAEPEVRRLYGVRRVGRLKDLRETFYALTHPRLEAHPGVALILDAARKRLHGTAE